MISELELLAYPGLTTPESERVKAFLADIAIVELTPLLKTHAVEIRKRFSLKLPDAIIAATAQARMPRSRPTISEYSRSPNSTPNRSACRLALRRYPLAGARYVPIMNTRAR